jgi:hypothetical protein
VSAFEKEGRHTLSGETDLGNLLSNLNPLLLDGDYVFCTVTNPVSASLSRLKPLASFSEAEGLSLLISRKRADAEGLDYQGVFKGITLRVHSSLDAVGLTAVVSSCLAERGIPANVIAARYHDYVFVPRDKATEALEHLQALADPDSDSTLTQRGHLK